MKSKLTRSFSAIFICAFALLQNGCGDNQLYESSNKLMFAPPLNTASLKSFSVNGMRDDYRIERTSTELTLILNSSKEQTRILVGEYSHIKFSDFSVNLRVGENAKTIPQSRLNNLIELYIAFFNRVPDSDGMDYWIDQIRDGMSISQLANNFYNAAIQYSSLTGYSSDMSEADFVKVIYKNVLGRTGTTAPQESEIAYWVESLTSGRTTKGDLITAMLAAAHTFVGDAEFGWVPQLLDNKVEVGKFVAIEQGLSHNSPEDSIKNFGLIAAAVTAHDFQNAKSLVGSTDINFNLTVQPNPQAAIELFTGSLGGSGNINGYGSDARFNAPYAIAIDKQNNIYIADRGNNLIRKISPNGKTTTIAGSGRSGIKDGKGLEAEFNQPSGIAINANGTVFVTDTGNSTVRQIGTNGEVRTIFGKAEEYGLKDGNATTARFSFPQGIVVDRQNNLIIADTGNNAIRKIDTEGIVTTILNPGSIHSPTKIAIDANDRLYAYDPRDHYLIRFDIEKNSREVLNVISHSVSGIAIAPSGDVIFTNTATSQIYKSDSNANITIFAGNQNLVPGYLDGSKLLARFDSPTDIVFDASGDIIIADTGNNAIRRIDRSDMVTTIAGLGANKGSLDDSKSKARFNFLRSLTINQKGELFAVDVYNNTIRKIDTRGSVTTFAGIAARISSARDGSISVATFDQPWDIYFDSADNLYVSNRVAGRALRKISNSEVSTIAPFTIPRHIYALAGMAFDKQGFAYATDHGKHAIFRTNFDDIKTVFSGSIDTSGKKDGGSSEALFDSPSGLTIDPLGNLFVADSANHCIRKITPDGKVATIAGSIGIGGYRDGAGKEALFKYPRNLVVDQSGNIFVSDQSSTVIRKITPSGGVSTIAGIPFLSGLSIGQVPRTLPLITGLTVDAMNTIFISSPYAVLRIKY